MADDNIEEEIQEAISEFKGAANRVGQDAQDAENLEEDAKKEADKAGQEAKAAAAETEEGEEKGSEAELEDAEKKQKAAEDDAGEAEKEAEAAANDIVDEIQLEEKQEQIIEKLQNEAAAILQQAQEDLKEEMSRLKAIKDSDNSQLTKANYTEIEHIIEEFVEAAEIVDTSSQMLPELMQELQETEKEELQLEQITSEISQELSFMEGEVKELARDFQMLQDPKEEKVAQEEAQELAAEEQEEEKLEAEEQNVDQEIRNELQEAETLVKQDEELLALVDSSIEELRALHELLESERSIWKMALKMNPPTKDVEQAINQLQEVLNRDENAIEKTSRFLSQLKSRAPTGAIGTAASGAKSFGKYGAIAGVVLFIGMVFLGVMFAGGL